MAVVPIVLVGYVLGTFPTALLVGRAKGVDPTRQGSRNPGASNVTRLAGARAGVIVFLGDVLKGAAAAGLGYVVDGRGLALAAGIAAVLGHIFPVTRRLRGGRGVAAAAGMLLVVEPLIMIPTAVGWGLIVAATKKASVASLLATVAIPVAVAALRRPLPEIVAVALVALLIVLRHAPNLRRLIKGDEPSVRGSEQ